MDSDWTPPTDVSPRALQPRPTRPTMSAVERKARRQMGLPVPGRRPRGYYKKQANHIYDLQMRESIIRWTVEGVSDADIAKRLGQSVATIKKYRNLSRERSKQRAGEQSSMTTPRDPRSRSPWPEDGSPTRALPPGRTTPPPPPPNEPPSAGGSGASFNSHPSNSSVIGTVLDSPEQIQLRKDCLYLRKAMVPFDQMAEMLGVSEREVRVATAEALQELETSEISNADLERRLMIEQLDQMIAAIHPMSTGRTLTQQRTPVLFEAIDRTIKLLAKKAELMGISHPPAIDIRIRLQALADEGGYDIQDLEEVARDVLQAHKIRLPEFREETTR